MIKGILGVKEPTLRIKSKPVLKIDKKIDTLIRDLKDTLVIQKDPEGVGLAAPQIGRNVRLFVIMPSPKDLRVYINPEILSISTEKNMPKTSTGKKIMEGCLSLPHYYGPLRRSQEVKVKFMDGFGKIQTETLKGLEAQIIQHEVDHLEGVLFIDRLIEQKTPLYEYIDGEWEKVDILL
jgi:peptide deformylase